MKFRTLSRLDNSGNTRHFGCVLPRWQLLAAVISSGKRLLSAILINQLIDTIQDASYNRRIAGEPSETETAEIQRKPADQ